MNFTRAVLLSAVAAVVAMPLSSTHKVLCEGFLPPNDMKIEVGANVNGGITNAEFNKALDKIEAYFGPIVSAKGKKLKVNRLWDDATVNASATQGFFGFGDWELNMYGGLARHPAMSFEGFMLVACHEMGHHLGGAPKLKDTFLGMGAWATNEGGSDYYASISCLRFMFNEADNAAYVARETMDPYLVQRCQEVYDTQAEENLCMRIGMGGYATADLFKNMKNLPTAPAFNTPDTTVAAVTNDKHPEPQCRLDTYFQGALCRHDINAPLNDRTASFGCLETAGNNTGVRPRCWFKP